VLSVEWETNHQIWFSWEHVIASEVDAFSE